MTDDRTLHSDALTGSAEGSDAVGEVEQLGPYRPLRLLGTGGMGEVWLAEQHEPVRRQVALKLIKLGMDTRQVIARFESERHALERMDHPNIARVFDAGVSGRGRPYFVMEFVDGVPIDAWCASRRASTGDRLELFLQVCAGVQHAHQKGIIHRDLKPSNLLVRLQDGRPVPKIIDFGVAKATTESGLATLQQTQLGELIGTPAYMSPEQAEITGAAIDTRSDVYSLGVVLYELLVGATPFEISERPLEEIRRAIREVEPQRPSTRVTRIGDAAEGVDHTRLARRLRGDLDWITLKALEKDPARRYDSVSQMAADVQRHLEHRPVIAGPPGGAYRLAKFVRRHRFGVSAGALVALALIGGAAVTTALMFRAQRAEAVARVEVIRANDEAEGAREIAAFLEGLFSISDPGQARGNSVTVREVLDAGAARIGASLADRPLLRARLMDTIGRVYLGLGLYDQARPLLAAAHESRVAELGPEHPETADSLRNLGRLASLTGDWPTARSLSERALELSLRHHGPSHTETARSEQNLATVLSRLGEVARARELFRAAAETRLAALGPADPDLAASLLGLADLTRFAGDHAAALPLYEQVRRIQERALGPDHPDLARTLESLARLHHAAGDDATARPLYLRALRIKREAFGPRHPEVAITLSGWADLLVAAGEPEQALEPLEQAIAIQRAVFGPGQPVEAYTTWQLAGVYRALGRGAEADDRYRRSLAIKRAAFGADHPEVIYDEACYAALSGRTDAALHLLERAVTRGFANPKLVDDEDLAALRNEPRFEALVARIRETD